MDKHIVFILTRYIGGGVEQCFNKTAYALMKNNKSICIYLYIVTKFTKKEQLPAGIIVIKDFKQLVVLKKKHKNLICVNYSSDWKSAFTTALISRRYISWIHLNPLVLQAARTGKIYFFLIKRAYKIVCVCHEQEELLHEIDGFEQSKLLTIYNCVDLESVSIKSKEHLDIGCKYILMAARFDFAQKDYPTLLKAYACLDESIRREYKLVLLGEGPNESAVRTMIKKLKMDEYVLLPGYDSNPFKWMKNASLFMLISKTEGFPLSVIEAMACETPVLITNYQTGAKEISQGGNNCMTVGVGDVKGLVEAITELLTNTNLTSKLTENSSLFVEKFNYKYFVQHTCDFFDNL